MVVKSAYNFNATQSHLEALNEWIVRLLGDDYALKLGKIREKEKFSLQMRCIHYFHGDDHYDRNPSAWIKVFLSEGKITSGCVVCGKAQIVFHNGVWQPAPSLRTLSHNNQHLIDTMLNLGCEEVRVVNGRRQTAVAFPVTYADGSQGFHYRIALEGKNKWRHMEGGSANEAVFGLHKEEVKQKIKSQGFVIITESPLDATVLNAAGFPAIAVLGKGQADALACDRHRETLLSLLGDAGTIYVWKEPDAAKFPQEVANALQRPVKVIYPPDYAKDAYRIWLACGKDWDRFRDEIVGLIQNTTEVAPQPKPVIEPKIVKVKRRFEEAVWRPLGEITMPQNDRWQVEGLIKEGNLVILSARPKTAKSIVALNLAGCVAMGKPFLDRSVTQGRALFVAYERHDLTLGRALAMGLKDCKDFMLWDKEAYGLPRVDCLDGWVDFIERNGVKLVVIDTLAHFLKPELAKVRNAINAYDHIYNVMGIIKSAAEETGCTFLLIHHDRKGETAETDEARVLGTTALTASPDAVFQLKSMSDKVICLKATGNAIEDTALYFRVGEDFWIELADKPATTKEEKAAREIENYLRQHGEATRQQLIDLILEIGLAENKTTASKLVDRAIQDRLVTRVKKEYKGRELVYHWQGGLKTTTTDKEFVYGVYRQGATVDIVDIVDNDRLVYGVYNSQPDPQRLTPKTNPISVANVYNSQPEGDPLATIEVWDYDKVFGDLSDDDGSPTLPDRPEGDPQAAQPEPDLQDSPPADDMFVDFFDAGLLPDLIGESNPPDLPANEPAGSLQPDRPDQSQGDQPDLPEGSLPTEPESVAESQPKAKDLFERYIAEVITEAKCPACETYLVPESNGKAACLGCGRLYFVILQQQTPAISGSVEEGSQTSATASDQSQPIETLNEPICPYCGEMLEPDPESKLATCAGCGRLFEVEDDDYPPESPDDGDDNPPNNGHNGGQSGFAPPKTPSIPPYAPTEDLIYTNKFNLPVIFNRMTERLPDGSVELTWQGKTETVKPDDLAGWQPIEDIPEIERPKIERVEIPPVVVLDLETDGLDPKRGRILAAGLALYVEGDAKEMTIIYNNDGEANLLLQVFDWLRETYDMFGEFILTGYNMFDFDLRFIIERSRRLGLISECPFVYLKDQNGNIKRLSIPDTDGKYTYTGIKTTLPIMLIDTQHLVIRNDMFEKVLLDYSLKSVAEHFKVNIPDRPKLSHEEIKHAFFNDRAKFNAYLFADLRETYNLFDLLSKPFASIAAITELDLEDIARKHGRGWIWQKHYERHYTTIPQADNYRKIVGGLVVSRKGLWFNCAKFDIASLYPTTILAYRIHSRKDPQQIGLRYLKTYLKERLELKRIAKETGDETAQMVQEGEKVLINSHFGYFASPFPFNDFDAAERVTKIGRKVLTCMIAAVEDIGGIVVEGDTDGLIVCCRDKEPEEIWRAISAAIPPVFKVEVEWQGMTVFLSEDKNYIVFDRNGDLIEVKGGKWRGRDKEAYMTKAIPTFVQLWATEGKEAALDYALCVLGEIRSGQGWCWVVRTHRVGKGDKFLIDAGFKVGEIATYAYKDRKHKTVAKSKTEGYDCYYYTKQFSDLVEEVIEAIDPAQIAAWRDIVNQEARPLT